MGVEHVARTEGARVEQSALLLLGADVGVPEEVRLDEGGLVLPAGRVHAGPEPPVERPEQVAFPGAAGLRRFVGAGVGLVVRVEAGDPRELGGGEVLPDVRHGGLGRGEEGVLEPVGVVPEVVLSRFDGAVLGDVLAPEEADAAGLLRVTTRGHRPLGGAVAGVPAPRVEEVAGVEVLVEVGEDTDSRVEEGSHLVGGRGEIGAVDLAAGGFGVRPGEQEAHGVAAAEGAQRRRGLRRVGDRGEGQPAVLLQLGLAGDVVSAQHDLAAEAVGERGRSPP